MGYFDIFYWLGILGGNVCYVVMLLVFGRGVKKAGTKKVGYMLLIVGMLTGFIVLNPFSKEIKLLGIVSENYGVFSNETRIVIGFICSIIPYVFMRGYHFMAFNLQQHHNKNKEKSVFYVYYTFFYLFHLVLWNAWMISSLFFAAAIGGHFKRSWEGIFGGLLVIYYTGGVCMAVLRQKTFEVESGHFKYNGLRRTCEGKLEDIGMVERTKKGVILHVREEKLYIGCRLEELADLFRDKIADSDISE